MWQRFIEEQGFVVLPDIVTPNEVADLLEEIPREVLQRKKAGVRNFLGTASVSALAHGSVLLGTARWVLGDGAFPFRATLFNKSQDANWLIPWHQDTALPLQEKRETPGWGPWSVKEGVTYAHAPANALNQVLALRIHLDDSTAENGPLRVLPATHLMGVLSDDAVSQLAAQQSAVSCLVAKGGVLAMRPLLIHASSKSTALKSRAVMNRRVLHIEYAACETMGDGLRLAVA
jgi:ectoine hydroxylase-related dioxygenase (phytanoyl-CoA dioxygenase family)